MRSAAALVRVVARLRSGNKRVVFTNGCFDILHVGHVAYLKRARELGDVLVVGLNSDSSVRDIKGKLRPINKEADRAIVLSALYFVDFVTIFDGATPERLIRAVKPDILVKGADWKAEEIVGADFVKSYGGRVVRIPFIKGYSTTSVIDKIGK
ncbi:MAG: D-glycero-beta-D-manno-heptose 1-phosphate adenylyltransferase [Candidatus Omnitrophica bacterium]|nr:D-glycero-beta-D-manno-heptose 1-phosphate adenylyltransferase [Candidatus Omnitrophota bacterium]MBU0895747.1 D-glycero-beta-D-manno-heptose 1-phosphate adenylyltransferase [Candidatus Omnitrophota bacterium]MBU1809448.1 D-glycero-beta-D-manno-heptose 1-phosphate adenylyltransferase [Candidatus Omnitrophota bacterium]